MSALHGRRPLFRAGESAETARRLHAVDEGTEARQERALASFAHAVSRGRSAVGKGGLSATVLALALFLVVAVSVFLFMTFGAQSYASVQQSRTDSSGLRSSSTLLLNSVRAADAADAVYAGEGPEGRSLVLVERLETGDFETRLYLCDGWVLQEYAVAGTPYTPGRASRVAESSTFEFSYADGLLTLTVDAGSTSVALRCADRSAS